MNIKELRETTGMTQKDFGEYLNIPWRTIQNWESEHRTPPEYVVELIECKIKKENEEMKDNAILEIKELQEEIDHRTKIENEAIRLIEECKFDEAIKLLATIDTSCLIK